MRTSVKLDSLGALIECRHENPFELLGPHEVEYKGSKALSVRAYLPDSAQAWIAHGTHTNRQPMRRIHPSGLFEAICPWPGNEGMTKYKLHVEDSAGQEYHDARSLRLSAAAEPIRSAFAERGSSLAVVRQTRRTHSHDRRCDRRELLPSGRRTHGASMSSATSTIGMGVRMRCGSTFPVASGNSSFPD